MQAIVALLKLDAHSKDYKAFVKRKKHELGSKVLLGAASPLVPAAEQLGSSASDLCWLRFTAEPHCPHLQAPQTYCFANKQLCAKMAALPGESGEFVGTASDMMAMMAAAVSLSFL